MTHCLIPILAFYLLSQPHPGDTIIPLKECVEVNSLNDSVLVITMGYDAVTAISTAKGIVVIDAGMSPSLASTYRDLIEEHFSGQKISFLINTHGHPDHTGGNLAFADATIIGQENCPREYEQNFSDPEKKIPALQKVVNEYTQELRDQDSLNEEWKYAYCQKLRYEYALNDFERCSSFYRWDITFRDSLHLDFGNLTMDLRYFCKSHSSSDIMIHVPEMKLLFTGDLFFPYGRPSFNFEPGNDCLEALEWLKDRLTRVTTVLGGHGQIMSLDDLLSFIDKVGEGLKRDK